MTPKLVPLDISAVQGEDAQLPVPTFTAVADTNTYNAIMDLVSETPKDAVTIQVKVDSIKEKIDLKKQDMLRLLLPGQWINDEVINAWRLVLSGYCVAQGMQRRVLVMNSFLFTKLFNRSLATPALLKWLVGTSPT